MKLHTHRMAKRKHDSAKGYEDVMKLDDLHIAGGTAKRSSPCGRQLSSFLVS